MGRYRAGAAEMASFAYIAFAWSLLVSFLTAADAAVLVTDARDIDGAQPARLVRRETLLSGQEEKQTHKAVDEQPTQHVNELLSSGSGDYAADLANMHLETRKAESLQRAMDRLAGLNVQEKTGELAKPTGLPDVAFAPDAYVVDKETHFASLDRFLAEQSNEATDEATDEGRISHIEYCAYDFPLGLWNTSNCSEDGSGVHELIDSEHMCAEAARRANATAGNGNHAYFRIPLDWGDYHPKGCFVFPCHWDEGHVCYFFNAQGDMPLYPWGAPVCTRPMFQNGTEDTNGGCPMGYDVIMDHEYCTEAQSCQSYCIEPNHLIGIDFPMHNASLTNEHPEGCFIHKEMGCVFFNPSLETIAHPPQEPEGTPICNVTQITHFPEIPVPWTPFWNG